MKIRRNKQKIEEGKQRLKRISEKRIRLPRLVRYTIIGVITIILLFSIITTYAAYNKPEKTTRTYETLSYNHNGNFDYRVYLKNNTVYEGREYLNPGEGKYFRKIVDYINASFTYIFYISKISNISGSYSLNGEIQTNQWTKKYTLIPETIITSKATTLNFTEDFQIDYQYYENVVNQINQEIGITTTNPILCLKFDIILNVNVEGKTIKQYFTPSINLTLGSSIIDISENLSKTQTGGITKTEEIIHQDVIDERNKWGIYSLIFTVIVIVVFLGTRNKKKELDKIQKQVKKILKKHGEWIVEVDNPIKKSFDSDIVNCKTIEDLMKISEEIGKPVIYNVPEKDVHIFSIVDNKIHYQYVLSEKKRKNPIHYSKKSILDKQEHIFNDKQVPKINQIKKDE
ncbi:MAG: DUF5305 family protein [Thermoplasmatota archaeon]|jgi:hypothetical protein